MSDHRDLDEAIVASWRKNASPWVDAVRQGQIASRRDATDAAIVGAVMSLRPRTVLDVGCGEGWLSHALAAEGVAVTGIDAVPELVDAARRGGPGVFRVLAYEELPSAEFAGRFDVVVCNFSLLGDAPTDAVVSAAARLLEPDGALIVQTLHPVIASGEGPYRDGWREGTWKGFDARFVDPAPWYFRTFGGWIGLFDAHGFRVVGVHEPVGADSGRPLSAIFVAEVDPA